MLRSFLLLVHKISIALRFIEDSWESPSIRIITCKKHILQSQDSEAMQVDQDEDPDGMGGLVEESGDDDRGDDEPLDMSNKNNAHLFTALGKIIELSQPGAQAVGVPGFQGGSMLVHQQYQQFVEAAASPSDRNMPAASTPHFQPSPSPSPSGADDNFAKQGSIDDLEEPLGSDDGISDEEELLADEDGCEGCCF